MAFYNEIFIEENGKLSHIGSCTGSDTPCYFDKVKDLNSWKEQLQKLEQKNGFWPHNNEHPFPWRTYKTSDNLIVLRPNRRRWFEFWKSTHQVWAAIDKYNINNENKSYFIPLDKWTDDFEKKDLVILEFPPLKKFS